MKQTITQNYNNEYECRTLRISAIASILGIGRSAAYSLAREAEASNGNPFKVMRLGNSLLVSKKSFEKYLEEHGM